MRSDLANLMIRVPPCWPQHSICRSVGFLLACFVLQPVGTTFGQNSRPERSLANPIKGTDPAGATCDEKALIGYENTLSTNPQNSEAADGEVACAMTLAIEARRAGDMDGALVFLARARHSVPNNPALLLAFGIQADALRLYRDADEAIVQALAIRPEDPQTIYALGHVRLDEQRLEDAEVYLRRYLDLEPKDATAHYGLGHLMRLLLKNEEAQAELRTSIRLQPGQTASYYELGLIAMEQNAKDEAINEFQMVLSRDANHAGASAGLGIIAYRTKDYANAEMLLTRSIQSAPDSIEAHHYLGMTLAKLGRMDESMQQLSIAETLTKDQRHMQSGFILQKEQPVK